MDIANVGITFNSAIKLMKAEACLVGKMADLRRKEVKHTLWFSASNALTLSMQLSLATLMVRSPKQWVIIRYPCIKYMLQNVYDLKHDKPCVLC